MAGMMNRRWYAVYTKPRQEDIASMHLLNAGIDVLNPKLRIKKTLRHKFVDVIAPLFPSYIFASFDPITEYRLVKYARGVNRIVEFNGVPAAVGEEVIGFIKSRLVNGMARIEPPELKPGDKVLLKEGPFQGLMGIFKREMKGSERVIILLSTLQYQASLVADKAVLTKV